MVEIDHPELPFKLEVIWYGNLVELYLTDKNSCREYRIRIWHTSSHKVMVQVRTWETLVEKEPEEKNEGV